MMKYLKCKKDKIINPYTLFITTNNYKITGNYSADSKPIWQGSAPGGSFLCISCTQRLPTALSKVLIICTDSFSIVTILYSHSTLLYYYYYKEAASKLKLWICSENLKLYICIIISQFLKLSFFSHFYCSVIIII